MPLAVGEQNPFPGVCTASDVAPTAFDRREANSRPAFFRRERAHAISVNNGVAIKGS